MFRRLIGSIRRLGSRVIRLLHRWAESGWAGPATATWSLLQSALVPGPTEALLLPLGLADPPRVFRLAVWGILGSVMGGLIAYGLGALAFDSVARPILDFLGVRSADVDAVGRLIDKYGSVAVFGAAFLPIASTKLICILSGAFQMPLLSYALALLGGRTIRFGVMALLIRFAGERLTARLKRKGAMSDAVAPQETTPVGN